MITIAFFDLNEIFDGVEKCDLHAEVFKYDTTPVIGTLASIAHAVEIAVALPFMVLLAVATAVGGLLVGNLVRFTQYMKDAGCLVIMGLATTILFSANAATLGIVSFTAKSLTSSRVPSK